MQPVATDAYRQGWLPLQQHRISPEQAWKEGTRPICTYLMRFCREKDLALIIEMTKVPPPKKPDELGLRILAPAYVLSELRASFQIGAVLFLPFLVIDLIVASLTLSIGMVQLPPAMISAPFKIMLFVLVDGWNLIVGSLLRSVS
jgi:flagellar biosynthetic protein FliP